MMEELTRPCVCLAYAGVKPRIVLDPNGAVQLMSSHLQGRMADIPHIYGI
jgi:hypothetical protein